MVGRRNRKPLYVRKCRRRSMSPETREKLFKFLRDNRVSVLSTCTAEAEPHSSVMHYSCAAELPRLFFSTDDRSAKATDCRANPRAAVALGWSETDWVTVQMRGALRALTVARGARGGEGGALCRPPKCARLRQRSAHALFALRAELGPILQPRRRPPAGRGNDAALRPPEPLLRPAWPARGARRSSQRRARGRAGSFPPG